MCSPSAILVYFCQLVSGPHVIDHCKKKCSWLSIRLSSVSPNPFICHTLLTVDLKWYTIHSLHSSGCAHSHVLSYNTWFLCFNIILICNHYLVVFSTTLICNYYIITYKHIYFILVSSSGA